MSYDKVMTDLYQVERFGIKFNWKLRSWLSNSEKFFNCKNSLLMSHKNPTDWQKYCFTYSIN